MKNEKLKNKREERTTKGISTFLLLLILTIGVVIVGFIVTLVGISLFEEHIGLNNEISILDGVINFVMIALLMVFFYFSLRGLKYLKAATEAAERGEVLEYEGGEGDIADLVSVVGRVSARMSINSVKQDKITDDYRAFVPRGILEYCHVNLHEEITPGIIGTVKGTRIMILLGNYKAGTDPRQYANLVDRIMGRGGRMLSCTSESIWAIFPGRKEEDVKFLEAELKETQIMNVRHGTFDIIVLGSRTSMYVRAKEHTY